MAEIQLSALCEIMSKQGFPARLEGEDMRIKAVNTLDLATDGDITFLSNPRYLSAVANTGAAAILAGDDVALPIGLSVIRCADPYAALTIAILTIHGHRRHPEWGVSQRATIHESARLGEKSNIAAGVTIAADVMLGDRCTLYPGCYVGDGVRLGDDCVLYPNVVVYEQCALGHRVTIHAGTVVGEDGLGYAPHEGRWVKIPQVGRTVIGDDVEIGANCSIDRATLGQTEIGAGTKFGNAIVIGHGAKIGRDCMFVGQVGVAGSATVGKHVILAGQVGVAGHISLGDDVSVGGGAGVVHDVEPGATLLGMPAHAAGETRRSWALVHQLPSWVRRIKDLECEIQALRETMSDLKEGD